MANILITGADGQLAGEFTHHLANSSHRVTTLNKEKLDISSMDSVLDAFSYFIPDIVLNCAAYNLVDRAEEDPESAFRINASGVKNLAIACKKNNALMVHYSTDYIFDGLKEDFYREDDIPNPLNKYGESKLSGERLLMNETDNFLIFRVSWVFGMGKQNFLFKLSEWAKNNRVLRIACDQVSVPTYTEDIVLSTMHAIDKGLRGIYHLTNSGYASRYEVAKYFIERLGLNNLLLPSDSAHFPSPAKRPYFSAMSNNKIKEAVGTEIPHWKDAIERFIKRLGG